MRSVIAEECHWTLLAYRLILEHERLTEAREMDRGYHAAKLTNLALLDPQKLHDEHTEWRETILAVRTPAPPMSRADLWTATMRIHRQLIERGIITPPEVN